MEIFQAALGVIGKVTLSATKELVEGKLDSQNPGSKVSQSMRLICGDLATDR